MKRNRVAGIVIRDNVVLVMRRVNKGDEYCAFPGGGQEEGETFEQTVVREIDEETTLKVKPGKLLYHIVWDTGDENFFYLCEYLAGEPQLRIDSEEFEQMEDGDQVYEPRWMEIEKLSSLKLYQLEVRDLFLKDYKNGFPEHVQELFIKFADRRQI